MILKGVSVYFNPGNMIGIMGPSGCGKTTFLDLLTGRRTTGTITVRTREGGRVRGIVGGMVGDMVGGSEGKIEKSGTR